MKKLLGYLGLASVVLTGNAMASVAEADCKTGTYGAGITVKFDGGKCVADIDADGTDHNNSLDQSVNVTVDSVYYFRSNSVGGASQTVALPFAVSKGCSVAGAAFHPIQKIYKNSNSQWVVNVPETYSISENGLEAGAPSIIRFVEKDAAKHHYIGFGGTGCTFVIDGSIEPKSKVFSANPDPKAPTGLTGTWTFKGVFSKKTWAESDVERSFSYGFASVESGSIKKGNFVKAGPSASVPPLRAYLVFNPTGSLSKAATFAAMSNVDVASILPNEIDIEYVAAQADDDDLLPETPAEDACFVNPAPGEDGYQSITIKTLNGKKVACIDGQSEARKQTVSFPEGVAVDSIAYNRTFKVESYQQGGGAISTIVFPFDVPYGCVEGATFHKVVFMERRITNWPDYEWVIYAGTTLTELKANTPYIVVPSEETLNFKSELGYGRSCGYVLKTDDIVKGEDFEVPAVGGTMALVGTYELIEWNEGHEDLGKVYGFAAKDKDGISAGKFVKAAAGASVPPMRAYLRYNPSGSLAKAAVGSSKFMAQAASVNDLPQSIRVVFQDSEFIEAASIRGMNIHTGVFTQDDRWFDMKGRELKGRPSIKGNYYHNGHLVTIK